MPASKLNYLVVYKNNSQVYGCASKKIAVDSPPPEGYDPQDKHVFYVTFEPDNDNLCLYKVDQDGNQIPLEEKSDDKESG